MYAGIRRLTIEDIDNGLTFPALVQYPTGAPSSPTAFGPYSMDVSMDAPLAAGSFPLLVVSHGGGGSHLVYRSITTFLARHGFVVAMLEHPGNNRNNNELGETDENLIYRPRHVRMTIDAVLKDPGLAPQVDADRIAVMGHSLGGYTAIALAGGVPWTRERRRLAVEHDPRVRALVLMSPACAFFIPEGALAQVRVPILLLQAELDSVTPPWHSDILRKGVPDPARIDYRLIENAGHFAFLTPFPAAMSGPHFPPSTDPEGFDREAFHRTLPSEILAFLEDRLARS